MTDSPPARPEEVSAKHVKDATDLARGVVVNVLGIVGKASRVLFLLFAAHFYGKTVLGLYFLAWSTSMYSGTSPGSSAGGTPIAPSPKNTVPMDADTWRAGVRPCSLGKHAPHVRPCTVRTSPS